MTRAKTKPPVHKPAFDADSALRFAAEESREMLDRFASSTSSGISPVQQANPLSETNRTGLTLLLKPETIARLKEEAVRKGKTVGQIVDKLVSKHLGKH